MILPLSQPECILHTLMHTFPFEFRPLYVVSKYESVRLEQDSVSWNCMIERKTAALVGQERLFCCLNGRDERI